MQKQSYTRLRRDPSRSSVPGSLPVLFFGDLFTAQAVTVGLNPSDREFLNAQKHELEGEARRFETLASLNAQDRSTLTDKQCALAVQTMRTYFQPGKPVYSWFRPLDRVMESMGFRYQVGEAAHLDLAQEATDPTWSALAKASPSEFAALRAQDLPFLQWQLAITPLALIVCNGRTVFDTVRALIGGQVLATGQMEKLTWYIGSASIAGRITGLAGWNLPLARPTGLDAKGQTELGHILAAELRKANVW